MRVKLPLLRRRYIAPARAPILRYGVAVLSITLALIPALMLSGVVESRLVVFSVAIMVSAWYGGWKPGLVATSFALTVSAYFSLAESHSPAEYRKAIIHLILFVFVAVLICSFNAALRSAQEGLRRSELNFRSLVTNAPYGICRCDSTGLLLGANPILVTMLGYSSASELLDRNLATLFSDSQHWFAAADALRSTQHFNGLIADWLRKDGATITVRLSGRTICDEDKSVYFEIFAEDVTEHRALEEQLRQAQKMEAVGRLAGGIAHDFNNLLMVISGHSELLLSELRAGDQTRKEVDGVIRAADRAASLTRQLLAFSRRQLLAPEILDLNSIVTNMEKMLPRLLGEDIHINKVLDPALGMVKADPNQIEQVIMNLAVNSRDAMPNGGKLRIATSNLDVAQEFHQGEICLGPGSYVLLSIKDTGEGMDTVTASRAFEPFFTTKEQGKGTGLGLSTVYGIVKQSEGEIWVESEPGKGAAFHICFPRVAQRTEAVKSARLPEASSGKETILIVKDENAVREVASIMLQRRAYNVISASTPREAQKI